MSCYSIKYPKCLNKNEQNLIIRWGEIDHKRQITTYYELKSDLDLFMIIKRDENTIATNQKITRFNDSLYCSLLKELRNTIIEVQTLNSPGNELTDFIEYFDPANNIQFIARWNPEFTNKGNEKFKKLFEQFQESLKSTKQK